MRDADVGNRDVDFSIHELIICRQLALLHSVPNCPIVRSTLYGHVFSLSSQTEVSAKLYSAPTYDSANVLSSLGARRTGHNIISKLQPTSRASRYYAVPDMGPRSLRTQQGFCGDEEPEAKRSVGYFHTPHGVIGTSYAGTRIYIRGYNLRTLTGWTVPLCCNLYLFWANKSKSNSLVATLGTLQNSRPHQIR